MTSGPQLTNNRYGALDPPVGGLFILRVASEAGVSISPGWGGRAKIEDSSERHPRNFALKRFLAVRKALAGKWGGLFLATSFGKLIGSSGEAPPSSTLGRYN